MRLVCRFGKVAAMARQPRIAPGGMIYHVLNRSAGKFKFLAREKDFQAFENLLVEAHARHPVRLFAYCLMGTHWHFVVLPAEDGDLTAFLSLADAHPRHALAGIAPHGRIWTPVSE